MLVAAASLFCFGNPLAERRDRRTRQARGCLIIGLPNRIMEARGTKGTRFPFSGFCQSTAVDLTQC